MKSNLLKFAFAAFALSTVLVSCRKDKQQETVLEALQTMEDASAADTHAQEADEETANQYKDGPTGSNSSGGPTVTWASARNTFPNQCTIDFGTGVTGRNGRVRSGQIIMNCSDAWNVPGATRTLTFVNHSVDSIGITGNVTVTNTTIDANGCRSFHRVANITLNFADGTLRSWTTDRTRTQIDGCATTDLSDDVWSVTGTASGTNRRGLAFTTTTSTPLIKANSCRWFRSGVLTHSVDGRTRTLDFGNGTCDNFASVTLDNGTVRNIRLR